VPWLNGIFATAPLSGAELGFCLLASTVVFVAAEIEKLLVRRGRIYTESPARAPAPRGAPAP
jgi:Ca2+-transporting ATPase